MGEYSVIRISESHVADLGIIFKDAFGQELQLEKFLKKQKTGLFGDELVGFIAYDQFNFPAAFYGVYPCQIEYRGKFYLAAQSGDTMTHSKHAGKGLFTQLATKTYEYCRENGFHLVFGFPNENSFPGFMKRLGWSHFDNLTPYLIRVKCIPWIRLKNTFKLSQFIHDKWCNLLLKIKKKGTPFKSSCLTADNPAVNRSKDYFNYKTYGENHLIQVTGKNIWLKFNDTMLLIGDIEQCSEEDFLRVIRKLKRIAFWMGLPHLRFHACSDTWGERMFKKHGKPMEVSYPVGGVNFTNAIPMEKMKFTAADKDTF